MDIFFCDLCGARVSDADLRAGHGARRRWDVICRACLEHGKGQAWLSTRAGMPPAVAAAVAAAGPSSPAPSAAAAVLDAPRDRARTLEQDEELERVAAQPVQRDGTSLDDDGVDLEPLPPPSLREDHVTTALVPGGNTEPELSSAAGAFARLGSDRQAKKPAPDDGDDLVDDDLVGDGLPGGITPTPAPAVSPFAFDAPGAPGGKDETARVEETPDKSPSAVRVPRSPSGARPKSSPSASRSGSPRTAKSTSGRVAKSGRRAAPDSGRRVLIGTAISAAVIVAVMAGLLLNRKGHEAKVIKNDPSKDLVTHIDSTRTVVLDALRGPKDVAKLQQALDRLHQSQTEVESFEKTATKLGLTEDEIGRILEQRCHWPELNSQSRTLREAIQAASNH